MSFLDPEFFYYLGVPTLVFFIILFMKKELEASYFSKEVIEKLRVSSKSLTTKKRNILFMIVSFLIIASLCEPVINDGVVKIKSKSSDIMIALDISDSMLAEDVYPNRLKLAKQKAIALLKLSPQQRVGVMGFAKNSYLVSPLSFDHNAVQFLLEELNTDSITQKGTNLLSMLQSVNDTIQTDAVKYLLILSDGGDKEEFSKEIEFAKENKIVIFILGIGTTKGAPVKNSSGEFIKHDGEVMVSKLNEDIAELATSSGGVYIQSVNSNEDVKAVLSEIESIGEKKEFKSQEIPRYTPLFQYPLGLALFFLLISFASFSFRNTAQLLVLATVMFNVQDANAGLLDFMELKEAKEAYEHGEYEKSGQIYEKFNTPESNYNRGNTLYKEKKYKEAIKSYESAQFEDDESDARKYANMGNSYAKEPTKENLQKALKSYESSLKLKDDKQTQENLEAVKKAIKEQEKKEEKKNKEDKKNDKEKSDKDENKKSDDDKNSEEDKKSDKDKKSKDKKSQDKDDKKDKDEKSKKDEDQKKKDKEAQEMSDNHSEQKPQEMKSKMSDEEEAKWLNELGKEKNTYMYRLNKENTQENTDEKPW